MADALATNDRKIDVVELSADIVCAYVSHNTLSISDLPKLIADVHGTLKALGTPTPAREAEDLHPAVPIRKSVTADYIVCLEDGRKFKSLRRHLKTQYGLTPDQYRQKWGPPADYPMVAANYSAARSRLARESGLGRKRPPARRR